MAEVTGNFFLPSPKTIFRSWKNWTSFLFFLCEEVFFRSLAGDPTIELHNNTRDRESCLNVRIDCRVLYDTTNVFGLELCSASFFTKHVYFLMLRETKVALFQVKKFGFLLFLPFLHH